MPGVSKAPVEGSIILTPKILKWPNSPYIPAMGFERWIGCFPTGCSWSFKVQTFQSGLSSILTVLTDRAIGRARNLYFLVLLPIADVELLLKKHTGLLHSITGLSVVASWLIEKITRCLSYQSVEYKHAFFIESKSVIGTVQTRTKRSTTKSSVEREQCVHSPDSKTEQLTFEIMNLNKSGRREAHMELLVNVRSVSHGFRVEKVLRAPGVARLLAHGHIRSEHVEHRQVIPIHALEASVHRSSFRLPTSTATLLGEH